MAADVFVIGYGDDTHATEVLRVEAPAMLARLTIVEPDAARFLEALATGARRIA